MATIDKVVESVGEFLGDVAAQKRDFERATQGLAVIDAYAERVEDALKAHTGFGVFSLPEKGRIEETEFNGGGVEFIVKSHTKVQKPKYKEAVDGFESYLTGLSFSNFEGRCVSGLVKEGKRLYVSVDSVVAAYDSIVLSIMKPQVAHKIEMTVDGKSNLGAAPTRIVLDSDTVTLDAMTYRNYADALALREELTAFASEYRQALDAMPESGEGVTQVNTRAGYQKKTVDAKTPNYFFVVKSLVTVPTDRGEEEGELNTLADPGISLAEKRRELPFYELINREVRGERVLYVGIQSIYDRIQALKQESIQNVTRTTLQHKEIV